MAALSGQCEECVRCRRCDWRMAVTLFWLSAFRLLSAFVFALRDACAGAEWIAAVFAVSCGKPGVVFTCARLALCDAVPVRLRVSCAAASACLLWLRASSLLFAFRACHPDQPNAVCGEWKHPCHERALSLELLHFHVATFLARVCGPLDDTHTSHGSSRLHGPTARISLQNCTHPHIIAYVIFNFCFSFHLRNSQFHAGGNCGVSERGFSR
jgi:hypothetical protein